MKNIYYLIFAVFIISSCQNTKPPVEDENEGHDHAEVSLKFTKYNSEYELFAEASPMVANQTGTILAHFTKLSDFSALTEGTVTASLIIGTKGIRQKLEKPTRPGIYLFQLQPEVSGKGKLLFEIETKEGRSLLTVNEIEVFADEHDAIHEAEEAIEEHPNAITFTKEQSWKIDFATGMPEVEPFGEVIKTTARVQSAQSEEIILTAKAGGIVQFKTNSMTEGAEVSKGKILFTISAESFADNNMNVRYSEAKTNFEKAEADYKRKSALIKDQLVSQKELIDSKAEYENAKTRYENLQKNFSEGGQNVVSSKSGFAKHIFVTNGEYVEAGQPLVSITENKNLYLRAEVQQKYAGALPYIKTATIRSLSNNVVFSLEELNGKVVSYAKNVSEESYLIPVTLQVENRAEILPGSFMEVFLKTESKTDALTVPNSALIEEQGSFKVFVQVDPESFEKREIRIGKTDGIKTEVLSGLIPKERIVTKGGILVKLAAASGKLDPHAGHVH
ncbi:efflux RND transporter periplasmic adaptor subunit [Prolixibacteraceae bacterium Z1-6]|uniref:Efflux RND transporter periplasmic adaptor subunit n=1 Tax=Draconibacterium aestuarii TaxID=2998507 RepID=A0A9X3FAI5_9BACT|nr:efflux RND transporter periplasmic adaptor subunit [Prolixibacteraceae bacterium Z1-6]